MAYPPRQEWGLALGAVLTELNQGHHGCLGGWGEGEHTRPWCRNTLAKWWGVEDRASFERTSAWLGAEGHRAQAHAMLESLPADPSADDPQRALLRAHAAELRGRSLLAWDFGRLVAVTGWGFWAGYVDEERAWVTILTAAYHCQKAYDSWATFGQHYELGRRFWSGQSDPACEAAIGKLLVEPESPWVRLPWDLDLGVVLAERTRMKRTRCSGCGAPKELPSKTAYVYCDYCGVLADFDFRLACSTTGSLRPGPAYEALLATLGPELEAAKAARDVERYRATQRRLFDAYIDACPAAVPPRVLDPTYRAAFAAFLADGATDVAFDEGAAGLGAAVRTATAGLRFVGSDPSKPKVETASFFHLFATWQAEYAYVCALHEKSGLATRHPDGASPELQARMGRSMFVQGWLPYLTDADASTVVRACGLEGEYVEPDVKDLASSHCSTCGTDVVYVPASKLRVCEGCGLSLEVGVATVSCGCGARLSPPRGAQRFECPYCKATHERMAYLAPA